jgi:hypothetical protein
MKAQAMELYEEFSPKLMFGDLDQFVQENY